MCRRTPQGRGEADSRVDAAVEENSTWREERICVSGLRKDGAKPISELTRHRRKIRRVGRRKITSAGRADLCQRTRQGRGEADSKGDAISEENSQRRGGQLCAGGCGRDGAKPIPKTMRQWRKIRISGRNSFASAHSARMERSRLQSGCGCGGKFAAAGGEKSLQRGGRICAGGCGRDGAKPIPEWAQHRRKIRAGGRRKITSARRADLCRQTR